MSNETTTSMPPAAAQERTAESYVEEAKRAFALDKYDEAAARYTDALQIVSAKHGEMSHEAAELYLRYGEALYFHAVSQTAVLGGQAPVKANGEQEAEGSAPALSTASEPAAPAVASSSSAAPTAGPSTAAGPSAPADSRFSFAGDDSEDEEDEEEEGGEAAQEEEEDDFGTAWEILDLAKVIFSKASGDAARVGQADAHMLLGDIALELERFEDATNEYLTALSLKKDLLPASSRQLAEAHYKLAIGYELTPGHVKRADALKEVETARATLLARLDELKARVEKGGDADTTDDALLSAAQKDAVARLNVEQAQKQVKEVGTLVEDLDEKIVELSAPPPAQSTEQGKTALEALLNATSQNPNAPKIAADAPVNVLSAVKKKKPSNAEGESAAAAAPVAEKRKAEESGEGAEEAKKAKVDS